MTFYIITRNGEYIGGATTKAKAHDRVRRERAYDDECTKAGWPDTGPYNYQVIASRDRHQAKVLLDAMPV